MDFSEQLKDAVTWTKAEKKTARTAFDKAFERHCATITAEVRQMLENVSAPSDIWRVQEYLSNIEKRSIESTNSDIQLCC